MRGVVVVACLSLASTWACAQLESDRQFEAGRSADLQNWEWRAKQGIPPTESEKAAQAVVGAIAERDCARAVAQLNAGLAKGHAELMLLAGAMYEEGVCLKPSWERGLALYEKAAAAGRPEALARIAAGYAAPVGGRDNAAALWWALKARTAMPAACSSVAAWVDDADRFVNALRAWPAGQLGACVYVAAVLATLQGDVAGPDLASAYGYQGKVRFRFDANAGRIDIAEELVVAPQPAGVLADAAQRESALRASRVAFSARLRQAADRAQKRYDKPAGLPADWRAEAEFVYMAAR
jgi:TPR repeat protein